MPEESDPRAVWRGQPEEKIAMTLEMFMNRRSRELASKTRLEIWVSIGAAVFFVAVMWMRFRAGAGPWQVAGFAAVIVWVMVSVYWMMRRVRGGTGVASSGVEYYRRELERRRDHLKNSWLWLGPLMLALGTMVATLVEKAVPGRLLNATPFFALLAVWVVMGALIRRKQARALEREIEEIQGLR